MQAYAWIIVVGQSLSPGPIFFNSRTRFFGHYIKQAPWHQVKRSKFPYSRPTRAQNFYARPISPGHGTLNFESCGGGFLARPTTQLLLPPSKCVYSSHHI